jgi:hypothetical protein
MLMPSDGAINILKTISERELCLHGDPSGPIPLFPLPLRPPGSRPRNSNEVEWRAHRVSPVDYSARLCAELLAQGLVEPMTPGAERGDRRFQISNKGHALLLALPSASQRAIK